MAFPLLIALAAGGLSALLFGSLLTRSAGSALFSYLASLPLLAVGLWAGPLGAGLAAVVGAVATAALGSLTFGATYVALNGGPAVLLVRQALLSRTNAEGGTEWYPPGHLVAWLAALAAVALVALALVLELVTEGGLRAVAAEALATFLDSMARALGTTDESAVMAPEVRDALAPLIPGLTGMSWFLTLAVNGTLAQALLVSLRLNRRPSPDLGAIALPAWLLAGLVIAGLATLLPGLLGFLGANLVLILLPAFVLAGLGILHAVSRPWPLRPLFLTAVYLLAFFLGWPLVVLALLGVFEPWIRLRQRFPGPPQA